MNINHHYYSHDINTITQLADDQPNNMVAATDDIKLNNQQILLKGLIQNLSLNSHQIDKDE